MTDEWLPLVLILGAVAVLIVLNALEFRAKRGADAKALDRFAKEDDAESWFARKRHETVQTIEQVLHIVNMVLIAILIAMLTR